MQDMIQKYRNQFNISPYENHFDCQYITIYHYMEKKVLYRPGIGKIDFYVNVQNDKIMYIVDVVMDDKLFVCMNVRQRKQAPVSKTIYRF